MNVHRRREVPYKFQVYSDCIHALYVVGATESMRGQIEKYGGLMHSILRTLGGGRGECALSSLTRRQSGDQRAL